jgi:hypothetical protein
MGVRPTPGRENHGCRHPRPSGGPPKPAKRWIPAPRLRGDKLRGDDRWGMIFREGLS